MLRMKKKLLTVFVAILIFIIFAVGGSVFENIKMSDVIQILILPFILNFYLMRATWYLTLSLPIDKENVLRLSVNHLVGLSVFVFMQIIFLRASAGLLSIINPGAWRLLADILLNYSFLIAALVYTVSVLIFYLIINIRKGYETEKIMIKNELQVKKAELNALKNVIQPHFLFNSFNTLTALIETDKENAGEFCRGLSDYLRYSLKFSESSFVTVEQELENLSNYLRVEKIRMGERLNIKYSVQEETKKINILPFSILTFVENGIKHGISNYIEGGKLEIFTRIVDNTLLIRVINPVKPRDAIRKKGEGLGISTLKKRLFIVFKDRASIKLYEDGKIHFSELTVKLSGDN